MPNPERMLSTIQRAVQLFKQTPGRRGRVVYLEGAAEVAIAGDMHGHLANFRSLLHKAALKEHPRRHLVVQELVHGALDYAAGGDKSHQMIDLLAALKCEFPQRVHMLLGNHEAAQWTNHKISKGDRDPVLSFVEGVQTAYGARADVIYAAYKDLFAVLPLAIKTPNRIYLSHSLPQASKLATFDPAVLERDQHDESEFRSGGSVHSLLWGRDTTAATAAAFLKKVDADLLITGHLPVEGGFEAPNDYQLILDSMREDGCFCLFPVDRPITHKQLLDCVRGL